jgi:hypothetical protein
MSFTTYKLRTQIEVGKLRYRPDRSAGRIVSRNDWKRRLKIKDTQIQTAK